LLIVCTPFGPLHGHGQKCAALIAPHAAAAGNMARKTCHYAQACRPDHFGSTCDQVAALMQIFRHYPRTGKRDKVFNKQRKSLLK
jgi:hypothetical protein